MSTTSPEVITFKHNSSSVDLVLWGGVKRATISSLKSEEQRKGHASQLMGIITSYADKHHLTLILEVSSYGTGLDDNQLVSFYRNHGFETVGDKTRKPMMEREPKIIIRGQESVRTDLRRQGAPSTTTEGSVNLDY